jgi:transglutaminase-like putative cysteine protease
MEQMSLQETVFCDFNHPAVLELAQSLGEDGKDAQTITQAVFKYVRDNIRFGFDPVQVKASETLEKGYGVCWNKALLTVALLRADKIPARLAYNPVNREFIIPVMGENYQMLTKTINHCFAQVYLNNEWICVDTTIDSLTYEKLFVPHHVAWGIDWNGTQDLRLYTDNIAGPVAYFEDIDAAVSRNVDNMFPPPAEFEALCKSVNDQMWQAVDA